MRRIAFAVSILALSLAACGGGGLTLTEYATQLEEAVTVMNDRLDEIDVELADAASVDEARRYWDGRIAAREEFLEVFLAIDPPESAVAMHEAAQDIVGRLTAAEAALGTLASTYETVADLGQIWDTPEGRAARAVDQEAVTICLAAQAMFDETTNREILSEVPWMTSELKELVDVVFGCIAAERGTG